MQLIAEDLVIERGGRTVIDGLSFSVPAGEALVLSGANGAGKTTLLRTIAGYLRASGGMIRLDGGDSELTIAEQAHVIGHANAVKSSLTVFENAAFWSEYLNSDATNGERTEAALRHFGLDDLI
ncbi:MAG TPA: ATP-binding cassette domain-containing protein, partial [Hyphomicrobium sp.]